MSSCFDYNMYLNIVLTSLLIISEILAFRENSSCCKSKKDNKDNKDNNKPRINGIIQGIVSISMSSSVKNNNQSPESSLVKIEKNKNKKKSSDQIQDTRINMSKIIYINNINDVNDNNGINNSDKVVELIDDIDNKTNKAIDNIDNNHAKINIDKLRSIIQHEILKNKPEKKDTEEKEYETVFSDI